MAEEREMWIDQAFSGHGYRVRERTADDVEMLGAFATLEQAELFMDRLLHPEKYVDVEPEPEPVEAEVETEKKRPKWTRGISPGDH